MCFIHFLKRLNEEPYIAGWIRTKYLANYGLGDEATNFVLGKPDLHGIEFAITNKGVDPWFRQIHHVEFKFPYHNTLWAEADDMGIYFDMNGLPIAGTRLKMDFTNNDDDIMGPDGSFSKDISLFLRRSEPFAQEPSGHGHWSDTKYFPAFMYDNSYRKGVPVIPGDKGHGDKRITGVWVDAATEETRYDFTSGGYVKLGDSTCFYDSTSPQGGILKNRTEATAGQYRLAWNGVKSYHDTLYVQGPSGELVLIRWLTTGFSAIIGRWVEAELGCAYHPGCDAWQTAILPVEGAREYRFCPLSKTDTNLVSGYSGSCDSLRVYDHATGEHLYSTTFTHKAAVSGRDVIHFTYDQGPVKLLDEQDVDSPRQLWIKFPDGHTTMLNEIKPYPLRNIGATGNNANQRFTLLNQSTANDSLWKFYIFDKYGNKALCYHELNDNLSRTFVTIYPDRILCTDSAKSFFWQEMFDCSIMLDSFRLVDYDSATGTASGLAGKDAGEFWPDSSWILQEHKMYVSSAVSIDTFIFRDTTRVIHWDFFLGDPVSAGVFTAIDTARHYFPCWNMHCDIANEKRTEFRSESMTVSNYPNPFNPVTIIQFEIPPPKAQDRHYTLKIYNIRGQLVRTLAKGVVSKNGLSRKVVWEGTDNLGLTVGSGMYIYRLEYGARVKRGTLVMVK
jgi:hypothetical protein